MIPILLNNGPHLVLPNLWEHTGFKWNFGKKALIRIPLPMLCQTLMQDDMFSGALKAARKSAVGKNLSDIKDRQKIMAALARRGYDYSTAKQALETLLDE